MAELFISYAMHHCTISDVTDTFNSVFEEDVVVKVSDATRKDKTTGRPFKMFWITLTLNDRVNRFIKEINDFGEACIIYETDKYNNQRYWKVRINVRPSTPSPDFKPRIMPREITLPTVTLADAQFAQFAPTADDIASLIRILGEVNARPFLKRTLPSASLDQRMTAKFDIDYILDEDERVEPADPDELCGFCHKSTCRKLTCIKGCELVQPGEISETSQSRLEPYCKEFHVVPYELKPSPYAEILANETPLSMALRQYEEEREDVKMLADGETPLMKAYRHYTTRS